MPHKTSELRREYREKNKERYAENFRRWETLNREQRNAYKRELWKKNPPKMTDEQREKVNAANRARRQADPERYRAYQREWRKNNPKQKQREIERLRLREYGVTPEMYAEMFDYQDGVCAICAEPQKSLHVDHCHETSVVRGLLCGKCNRGLGMFKDRPLLLQKAIFYLERHATKTRHTA